MSRPSRSEHGGVSATSSSRSQAHKPSRNAGSEASASAMTGRIAVFQAPAALVRTASRRCTDVPSVAPCLPTRAQFSGTANTLRSRNCWHLRAHELANAMKPDPADLPLKGSVYIGRAATHLTPASLDRRDARRSRTPKGLGLSRKCRSSHFSQRYAPGCGRRDTEWLGEFMWDVK